MKIPINDLRRHNALLDSELRSAIDRVLTRGYYILGAETEGFEHEFAAYLGVAWAAGVGNGTDALELALRTLEVGPGDEVITVANAGMYATTAIRSIGAVPRYVDIEPDGMLMNPDVLIEALSSKVRAIVVTHLYGRMVNMPAVSLIARSYGVPLIEDCAQAHGAQWGGRFAGAWGDLATFSFYPTKNLGALGDGGMVVGADQALAVRLRSLRQYGWQRVKYECSTPGGRNSRLDELQAAILRVKLPLLDKWNHRRREIVRHYIDGLDGLGWKLPPQPNETDVAHLCVIRADHRDLVCSALLEQGVSCDIHYPIPDHHQLAYTNQQNCVLPVTEQACSTVLTLPCFPELSNEELSLVIDACHRAAKRQGQ